MKKILVLGAGFLQSFLIKKAKEMGYYTLTIDKNPNSVGFQYADEYKIIDIVNQKECVSFAEKNGIDGVITGATDYGVLSTAYIAQQLNLPGLHYKVAEVIKNKYMVRKILNENKVDDGFQCFEIYNTSQLDRVIGKVRFPVMVKPSDGSGSKGAARVDSVEDLARACKTAIEASLIGKAIIESFIVGKEYGVESFVYNGKVHVLGIMNKYMTNPPVYAELGHCIPSQLEIEDKVKEVVIKAIKVLGINFGAVNMDVLVTKNNQIYIVDIGARMGGNLIGSHIIPSGTGIDYMDVLIRSAVGDSINLQAQNINKKVVTRLLALHPGRVKKLPNFREIQENCQVEIYHHLNIGSQIRDYRNNLDGYGYVLSVSNNLESANRQAEEAKNLIDLGIIRE